MRGERLLLRALTCLSAFRSVSTNEGERLVVLNFERQMKRWLDASRADARKPKLWVTVFVPKQGFWRRFSRRVNINTQCGRSSFRSLMDT